ncbi:cytochrome c3 family protein [Pelovirga terrestris]|uniref:Cytochrome c3 family protein n=1 Tax=Pelovirga terrestris TaxID=2771352 RepID=A0A8J6ULG3_9BACT|nr:cytochrome c3 family protein [Pelovirga terrestris]MBD1401102.1 cytochrome c3 family protein [Pelovirga terrestris]
MKKSLLFVLIALLGLPMAAAAAITGDCAGCHTMHNSEENAPVAKMGIGGATEAPTPIANLLRFDCIACHAQNTNKVVNINGSDIPQVYHDDASGDLAGGNFRHIADAKTAGDPNANRKGHNVIDLFPGGDNTSGTYTRPPGFRVVSDHDDAFGTNDFAKFTCAGAAGCHGTRNQNISGVGPGGIQRTGMAAISGAHHQNVDAKKDFGQVSGVSHSGLAVAQGYRFIPGLKGLGAADWQNTDEENHNEYYGVAAVVGQTCGTCHVGGTDKEVATQIRVPNQSMSGFCSTCHGNFHSTGLETGTAFNGTSGAFLRHPSDYVIPDERGYELYTEYNVTAPVARNAVTFNELSSPSAVVTPGQDMVMCLSCHKAHASEYDAMLRFDYTLMTANSSGTDGCLACHTNK